MWCRWGVSCGLCLIGGDCRSWGLGQRCPEALHSLLPARGTREQGGHQQRPEQWKRNFFACSSCCSPPFSSPSPFPSSSIFSSPSPPPLLFFTLLPLPHLFHLPLLPNLFLLPHSSARPVRPWFLVTMETTSPASPVLIGFSWPLASWPWLQGLYPQFSCIPQLEGVCRFSCTVELAEMSLCRVKPDWV